MYNTCYTYCKEGIYMQYRTVGKTGKGTLYVTIPVEVSLALGLKKADVVRVTRVKDGFMVELDKPAVGSGIEFDS
mgnify:CR=1 FL=1